MDEWMDEWMDAWMNGWMVSKIEVRKRRDFRREESYCDCYTVDSKNSKFKSRSFLLDFFPFISFSLQKEDDQIILDQIIVIVVIKERGTETRAQPESGPDEWIA